MSTISTISRTVLVLFVTTAGFSGCQLRGLESDSYQIFEVDAKAAQKSDRGPKEEVNDFIERLNQHRKKVGCAPLKTDAKLTRTAELHAKDMEKRNYFSHISPEGKSPFDRMEQQGVDYQTAAENIAQGQPTGKMVFEQWLASPGHKRNMENCRLKYHGVAFTTKKNTWVHTFATFFN